VRDHGKAVDPKWRCEAPVRGQRNRRCLNRPLLGSPFCFRHSYEASEPKGAPEPGYEWYPLRDGLSRPYFWFQFRTKTATRRARYLNRHGATLSAAERDEIRRVLVEKLLRRKTLEAPSRGWHRRGPGPKRTKGPGGNRGPGSTG
jgi:hypothetical protein